MKAAERIAAVAKRHGRDEIGYVPECHCVRIGNAILSPELLRALADALDGAPEATSAAMTDLMEDLMQATADNALLAAKNITLLDRLARRRHAQSE